MMAGADGDVTLKLTPRQVKKPWGRVALPPPFDNPTGDRIGEIWFEGPAGADMPFLTKYIFTSERLSVQVHPDDSRAKSTSLERGKTECWYVLDADPTAEIGLGLAEPVAPDELRSAAIDGSIVGMLNWLGVKPGDFFYVPAGTIHAIGAGVSLLEFQQNSDVTYRLYDYGRPRELHLDEAIEVSSLKSHVRSGVKADQSAPAILHSGEDFTVVRARAGGDVPATLNDRLRWVMPLKGSVASNGDLAAAGECLLVEPGAPIRIGGNSVALIAAGGAIS